MKRLPRLSLAAKETLELIEAAPGLYLAEIARKRGVSKDVAQRGVRTLQKRGLVRLENSRAPNTRGVVIRCYYTHAPDAVDIMAELDMTAATVLKALSAEPQNRTAVYEALFKRGKLYALSTVTNTLSLLWRLQIVDRTADHRYSLNALGEEVLEVLWALEAA